ncbi:MAG: helix-turn-helix domain-containing protein [Lachnospiraceae bacterium]|nr:helix-turn-helix domain-containing protein [Lachnospiraceae bacterium]
MTLGDNIQWLRKMNNITQEELAERLSVSRQTISKWEMNQTYPEIPKLIEIGNLFNCKVDELLKKDLCKNQEVYSEITIKEVTGFRMGRYVMISPNPEDDVNSYMDRWAESSGLNDIPGYKAKRIGWDFPFVSAEQQSRFGLRGYVAAYILPDDFEPRCEGVEIVSQNTTTYACITICDPFSRAFEYIPGGYKKILDYLNANGFKENVSGEYLSCFEYVYEKEDITYMEVYIHVDSVGHANLFTPLR